ncbi:hypothetical protein [Mycoplasmopsis alligatoris]|uniref:hypothetical protein n=1 Tax=Mycoplasmopsis alligatoris TaxID=47687 RepID=UPI0002D60B91|nr:hypothetical protein [Mycoplasmopsis alligatoris]
MDKYKIYVDFEAIDSKLLRQLKLKRKHLHFPYCYTIGYNNNGQFKTITKILKLKNLNSDNIYRTLKGSLCTDINKLVGQKINIDAQSVVFIGWNPSLETYITQYLFKMPTQPQIMLNNFSLDFVSKGGEFKSNYFDSVMNLKLKNRAFKSVLKFNKSGYTAAFIGALLLAHYQNIPFEESKLSEKQINLILKELREYNQDDVLKMWYVEQNINEVNMKVNNIRNIELEIHSKDHELREILTSAEYISINFLNKNLSYDVFKKELILKISKLKEQAKKFKSEEVHSIESIKIFNELRRAKKCLILITDTERNIANIEEFLTILLNKVKIINNDVTELKNCLSKAREE